MSFKTFIISFAIGFSFMSHSGTLPQKTSIWISIPFFNSGDLGQYVNTMSQNRDQVRKSFWNELTTALNQLSQSSMSPELLIEPLTKALMLFDQVHDRHKYIDSYLIDQSLEAQFKSNLDILYRQYDIREPQRKIELIGDQKVLANLNGYIAYGTFSSLGRGLFNLTFHLQSLRTGKIISFSHQGRLLDALQELAKDVFTEFQKIETPAWEDPQPVLRWLPQPTQPDKTEFTLTEVKLYCQARGYRLPYTRELMLAESGTEFNPGGIRRLVQQGTYPVLDQRRTSEPFIYRPGFESASGGPIMAAVLAPKLMKFYCVQGEPSKDVLRVEKLWSLRRKHIESKQIVRAIDTLRADAGDFDTDAIFWGPRLEMLTLMSSAEEAMRILKINGISL